jgi:hypothetical protein
MAVRRGTINKVGPGNTINRVDPAPSSRLRRMMRLPHERKLLPTVQGVAAGSTAFLDLPLGTTYHALHLFYGGTTFTPAKMNAIRIQANGQWIHNLTGTLRDVINQFDKLPAASTYKVLTIPFFREGLRDGSDMHTGLATLFRCDQCPVGITQLRIEIDIDPTAVAPTLVIFADHRANDKRFSRALLRHETFVEVVPVLTNADYTWTHKYNADAFRPMIQRLIMDQADSEITNFKMQADTREHFNRAAKVNEHVQAMHRSPQAGYTFIDSGEDLYSHPWRVGDLADHRIITTHAAGNVNMKVVAETLGALGD